MLQFDVYCTYGIMHLQSFNWIGTSRMTKSAHDSSLAKFRVGIVRSS